MSLQTTLEQLIEEITFRRRKELRIHEEQKCGGYSSTQNTTYWTDLFVRHFLFQTEYEADRDDLLFFIRKTGQSQATSPGSGSTSASASTQPSLAHHKKQHTTVEVRLRLIGPKRNTFLYN